MIDPAPAATPDRRDYDPGMLSPASRVALLLNKRAILDALVAAGLTSVIVRFTGCGFGSDIDEILAYRRETPVRLPDVIVAYAQAASRGGVPRQRLPLRDSLVFVLDDIVCDDIVTAIGCGGSLTIHVAERILQFDARAHAPDEPHICRYY